MLPRIGLSTWVKKLNNENKIVTSDSIVELVDKLHQQGKRIGMCHGVFDLLHPGHFAHFKSAKSRVDVLFVSVTGDHYVNKGPGRPLFSELVRTQTISALEYVDYVIISENETAVESIDLIKPHVYFKGSDYANTKDDVTGMIEVEISQVKRYGGEIEFTNEITSSSTTLINNFFSLHSEELNKWLKSFRNRFSTQDVNKYLDLVEATRVSVFGEIIIDRYTNCEPLAKSSKDPILAFQIRETNTFLGGILAIGDNVRSWTKNVSLVSSLPETVREDQIILTQQISRIQSLHTVKTKKPLIIKHRYVDEGSQARIFETYDFDQSEFIQEEHSLYRLIERSSAMSDICIIADYGHGLISKSLARKIGSIDNFIAINTQANAGNRGYNTITKYPRADFISLNGGELQLELRDRNPNYEAIVPQYMKKMNSKYAVLTLGAKGMMVFSKDHFASIPALGSRVVDKVGAGDSVLAIGSILAKHSAPSEIIGLISSIVAAHEIGQLGHRTSLRVADIKKAVKGLLG